MINTKKVLSVVVSATLLSSSASLSALATENNKLIESNNKPLVYHSSKPKLSAFESKNLIEIEECANTDINIVADLINNVKDNKIYEVYLEAALDNYYSNIDCNYDEIEFLKNNLDNRAHDIISDYEAAAAERANQENLNYDTTSVIITFDKDIPNDYIEEYLEDNALGYDVLFDGKIEANENLPAEKLENLKEQISNIEDNNFNKIYSADLRLNQTTDMAIEEFSSCSETVEVCKNYIEECQEFDTPQSYKKDPYENQQYYLNTVNVLDAYNLWVDSSYMNTCVAVLDSGIDMSHEDLKSNISNYSYDITENKLLKNCTTQYTSPHGTEVAGVISAVSGNGKGITGVASGVGYNDIPVMAIKITDNSDGKAYTSSFIKAIPYAVENGADVISISYTNPIYNQSYQDVIDTAAECNVTVVASAGNDGNKGNPTLYPASYNNVLSVAATDSNNRKAYFSNYGDSVDFAAPGVDIMTTAPNNEYVKVNGTSFSAPIGASAVAMIKSIWPSTYPAQIERIIDHTVTDINDDTIGTGLLNIGLAMEYARYVNFKNYNTILSKVVSKSPNTATVRAKISNQYDYNPTGFAIYRSTSKDGSYSKVKTITEDNFFTVTTWTVVQWTNNGLTSGKTYYYKVRAYVKYGKEVRYCNYSNVIPVTVS